MDWDGAGPELGLGPDWDWDWDRTGLALDQHWDLGLYRAVTTTDTRNWKRTGTGLG